MSHYQYLYITGVVRALESKRLNREVYEALLKAPSVEDAHSILINTQYQDFIIGEDKDSGFERMLLNRRLWLLDLIDHYSLQKELAFFFRLGFDYHNLKVLIKNKILDRDDRGVLVDYGTIPKEHLIPIIYNEQYELLNPIMNEALVRSIESYYENQNLLFIDLHLDRALYEDLMKRMECVGSIFILNYLRLKVDLINIRTMARAMELRLLEKINRLLYLEGGNIDMDLLYDTEGEAMQLMEGIADANNYKKFPGDLKETENPFALDRASEEILWIYLQTAKFLIQGIEPLFSYAEAVELEIKTLGFILRGLQGGLDADWIQMRMPRIFH